MQARIYIGNLLHERYTKINQWIKIESNLYLFFNKSIINKNV
jgi:hypothetical protein